MINLGLSCWQAFAARKDGIGIYTKELASHLLQQQPIAISNIALNYYAVNLISSLWLKTAYYRDTSLKRQLDLLHVTDYRIPKLTHIPVIATLHDAIPLQYPEWVNANWRKLKNLALVASAKWLTHVIALSHFTVPDLVNYWRIPEEKITVVYPGVAKAWFDSVSQAKKNRILDKYHIHNRFFLFVGTLQPRKNIIRTIKAYQALPKAIKQDYSLILVGQPGWNHSEILQAIQALTDSGYGKWLNYLPVEDIHALYQSACAFVFPSLYEGFGLPVLEAFASGVPVITSSHSAMSEIADDCALLVDPDSIEAISAALMKLVDNPDLSKNLIAAGRNKAQLFNWETSAEKTLAVYKNVLEK